MPKRPTFTGATTPLPLALQWSELALAVPQVVGHRLTRLALAGASPSARDRREFSTMGMEKAAAFQESWAGMWWQAALAQQRFALDCWRAAFTLGSGAQQAAWSRAVQQAAGATLGLAGHGMAPVHRRAVANARRLRRTPLLPGRP